jgi:hypothetical protein
MGYVGMTEAGEYLITKIFPTFFFYNVLLHFLFKILKNIQKKLEINEVLSLTLTEQHKTV